MRNFYWLTLTLLLLTSRASSQNLDRLDERNGFKDLILGSKASNYSHLVFIRAHDDQKGIPNGKILGAEKGHYKSIGSVEVEAVEVTVYNDYILGISVRTPKDPNLLKGLKRAYGPSTQTLGTTSFVWETDKLTLAFKSFSKSQLELYYHSIPVRQMIKNDKAQKIQDIADDF